MKLKRGNDVIDVPENKVAYFLHAGYVKVEEVVILPEEPVETPKKKPVLVKSGWKEE